MLPLMTGKQANRAFAVLPETRTTAWAPSHVAAISQQEIQQIPVIRAGDVVKAINDVDIWDSWPVQNADGSVASVGGRELWMALAAPFHQDTMQRHYYARIRLFERNESVWSDCGNLLPDGFSPGSREWSGSALYGGTDQTVTLFFTAAGRRDEATFTFEQRIFQTTGRVSMDGNRTSLVGWSQPVEAFAADGVIYMRADQSDGKIGEIKAFRDPAVFQDPQTGDFYILFAGSLGNSSSKHNGAIGLARANGQGFSGWTLLPPLITADELNNELERPHIVMHDGRYYLFWSTQQHVFAPAGPNGPTGLYGMVSENILGPYRPLNGTGLVAANPSEEPLQGYSWLVLDTLEVTSFIDFWGLEGRSADPGSSLVRHQFGGTFAPRFSLRLDGDRAEIVRP